jgi:hypothetical protein
MTLNLRSNIVKIVDKYSGIDDLLFYRNGDGLLIFRNDDELLFDRSGEEAVMSY